MATVDVSTATVSKVIRREEFKGVTADRKAKAWALEPLGRYSQGDGVGGTGSSPVALQGAHVSIWTRLICHLAWVTAQRLWSLHIGRDPTFGFRAQN